MGHIWNGIQILLAGSWLFETTGFSFIKINQTNPKSDHELDPNPNYFFDIYNLLFIIINMNGLTHHLKFK